MNNVNKTLYIPLFGKAYVSKKGLFLNDKSAEKIWEADGFVLKGKSKSKWLAYYMGIRSRVFDDWVCEELNKNGSAVVLHIGCGMDSRVTRVGAKERVWYDIDFPEVITERKKYFSDGEHYRMIGTDVRCPEWLDVIPRGVDAIVVMEGVSMYMSTEDIHRLTDDLCEHFSKVALLMDCYSTFAAKMSRYKNPINDVGVTEVYGIDSPTELEHGKLSFVREHKMTPKKYIDELRGFERFIFSRLYAGGFAKKLYRLYEFNKK